MNNKPTILIIFGISGDLAKRYLLPAIEVIAKAKMLPSSFHVVGITRRSDVSIDSILEKIPDKNLWQAQNKFLKENMSIFEMDVENVNDYKKLDEFLTEKEKLFNEPTQRLFYLSIPPKISKSVIEFLGESNLHKEKETRLLLEKPFGINLENALGLSKHINKYFSTAKVYRVDHYMAKETAQNIIIFRDGNSLFKKTWNKDFIESIEIVVSEKMGIEGRANFYEKTGALRDMVQSHLLQLLSLILMEVPKSEKLEGVPALRLEALKKISIDDVLKDVKRGQYEGYLVDIDKSSSNVETFVSLKLKSSDPLWEGVPITLTTGKALDKKLTEIRILYKKDKNHEANELFLQLYPKGGIQFNMWAKRPGYEHSVNCHHLGFKFEEYYDVLPEAYEQVLFNAINSDHSLFTSGEEILETWRILDPLQKFWEKYSDDLVIYKKGSTIDEVINKNK